jgi:hypothetical protein
MTPEQMAEEQRLVDHLVAMVDEVRQGIARGDSPQCWRDRRAEIADLRRRVRELRVAHLGH